MLACRKINRKPTTLETEKIIKWINSKDSRGYEEFSTKLLKISYQFISPPLNCMFNKLLTKGTFSNRCKFSIIKPLYQKGVKGYPATNISPKIIFQNFWKDNAITIIKIFT
jgi:hypothetical protein